MGVFAFEHGASELKGLGGSLQRLEDTQARSDQQVLQAEKINLGIKREQNDLKQHLDRMGAQADSFEREETERINSSKIMSQIMGGGDLSGVPPEELTSMLAGVPSHVQVSATQMVNRQREQAAKQKQARLSEGQIRGLQSRIKSGDIGEEEYEDAVGLAQQGDNSGLDAITARLRDTDVRREGIKTDITHINGLLGSPTFMAALPEDARGMFSEAMALMNNAMSGNAYDEDQIQEARELMEEAQTPARIRREREIMQQQLEEQQARIEQLQNPLGLTNLIGDNGSPLEQSRFQQNNDPNKQARAVTGFTAREAPSVFDLHDEEQGKIKDALISMGGDILSESGIDASEMPKDQFFAALSELAHEVYGVQIGSDEMLAFMGSAPGGQGELDELTSQGPIFERPGPEAASARSLRERARGLTGSPLAMVKELGVSVAELGAVADDPTKPAKEWTFNDHKAEQSLRSQDSKRTKAAQSTVGRYAAGI